MIIDASLKLIPNLVEHHVAMFKEIYAKEQKSVDEPAFNRMAVAYGKKLRKQLYEKTCYAWVIKSDMKIAASCALSLQEGVPIPTDPNITIGYLHSVYTVPEFRCKGYASQLLKHTIAFSHSIGIHRIDLAASTAGKKVYERLGFSDFPYSMRLTTRKADTVS